jgi:hypothetical protein
MIHKWKFTFVVTKVQYEPRSSLCMSDLFSSYFHASLRISEFQTQLHL